MIKILFLIFMFYVTIGFAADQKSLPPEILFRYKLSVFRTHHKKVPEWITAMCEKKRLEFSKSSSKTEEEEEFTSYLNIFYRIVFENPFCLSAKDLEIAVKCITKFDGVLKYKQAIHKLIVYICEPGEIRDLYFSSDLYLFLTTPGVIPEVTIDENTLTLHGNLFCHKRRERIFPALEIVLEMHQKILLTDLPITEEYLLLFVPLQSSEVIESLRIINCPANFLSTEKGSLGNGEFSFKSLNLQSFEWNGSLAGHRIMVFVAALPSTITSLKIPGARFNTTEGRFLTTLKKFENLQILDLSDNNLTEKCLPILTEVLKKLINIKSLNLANNHFGNSILDTLVELSKFIKLDYLNLNNTGLNLHSFGLDWSTILNNGSILSIKNNGDTENSFEYLSTHNSLLQKCKKISFDLHKTEESKSTQRSNDFISRLKPINTVGILDTEKQVHLNIDLLMFLHLFSGFHYSDKGLLIECSIKPSEKLSLGKYENKLDRKKRIPCHPLLSLWKNVTTFEHLKLASHAYSDEILQGFSSFQFLKLSLIDNCLRLSKKQCHKFFKKQDMLTTLYISNISNGWTICKAMFEAWIESAITPPLQSLKIEKLALDVYNLIELLQFIKNIKTFKTLRFEVRVSGNEFEPSKHSGTNDKESKCPKSNYLFDISSMKWLWSEEVKLEQSNEISSLEKKFYTLNYCKKKLSRKTNSDSVILPTPIPKENVHNIIGELTHVEELEFNVISDDYITRKEFTLSLLKFFPNLLKLKINSVSSQIILFRIFLIMKQLRDITLCMYATEVRDSGLEYLSYLPFLTNLSIIENFNIENAALLEKLSPEHDIIFDQNTSKDNLEESFCNLNKLEISRSILLRDVYLSKAQCIRELRISSIYKNGIFNVEDLMNYRLLKKLYKSDLFKEVQQERGSLPFSQQYHFSGSSNRSIRSSESSQRNHGSQGSQALSNYPQRDPGHYFSQVQTIASDNDQQYLTMERCVPDHIYEEINYAMCTHTTQTQTPQLCTGTVSRASSSVSGKSGNTKYPASNSIRHCYQCSNDASVPLNDGYEVPNGIMKNNEVSNILSDPVSQNECTCTCHGDTAPAASKAIKLVLNDIDICLDMGTSWLETALCQMINPSSLLYLNTNQGLADKDKRELLVRYPMLKKLNGEPRETLVKKCERFR